MNASPPDRRPVWDRASLPTPVAVGRATSVAAVALVVVALAALVAGPGAALSALGAGVVVLAVLWGSARALSRGARRTRPAGALLLALGLYLGAVIGLFALAVVVQLVLGDDGLSGPGVAAGILTVALAWTAGLVAVHVRHDRLPRRRG